MNRLIYLLLSLLLSLPPSRAQTKPACQVGLKMGLNLARFVELGNPVPNTFIPAYALGLTAQLKLTNRFWLSGDLLYSRQGNRVNLLNPTVYGEHILAQYDYLILPLLLKYQPRHLPLFVGAGLQAGLLLANQTHYVPQLGFSLSDNPFVKKSDVGWLVTVGHQFGRHVSLEVGYYKSLRTIEKGYQGPDPSTGQFIVQPPVQLYNQVLRASLSLYFN